MLKRKAHPDQLVLDLSKDAALERMIEARVAIRAENAALRWRCRLLLIETAMLGSIVLVAGSAIGQPTAVVVRASLIAGAGCLLSGFMAIALSRLTGVLFSGVRRWRRR